MGFVGGAGNIIDLRKPKMSTRPMNDPKAIPTISKVLRAHLALEIRNVIPDKV